MNSKAAERMIHSRFTDPAGLNHTIVHASDLGKMIAAADEYLDPAGQHLKTIKRPSRWRYWPTTPTACEKQHLTLP
jgi:hypothetical protein